MVIFLLKLNKSVITESGNQRMLKVVIRDFKRLKEIKREFKLISLYGAWFLLLLITKGFLTILSFWHLCKSFKTNSSTI